MRSRLWPVFGLTLLAAFVASPGFAQDPAALLAVSLAGPAIKQAEDLNLYGVVIARDARRNIALLGIQDGRAFPYRPGEEVAASWRLLAVDATTATVADPTGEQYRLAMVPDDGSGRGQAVARLPPIKPVSVSEPTALPTDEKLEQARREFNLPASD